MMSTPVAAAVVAREEVCHLVVMAAGSSGWSLLPLRASPASCPPCCSCVVAASSL